MLEIPVLWKWMDDDPEFEDSLGYIVKSKEELKKTELRKLFSC
jgi:hypothetical protein